MHRHIKYGTILQWETTRLSINALAIAAATHMIWSGHKRIRLGCRMASTTGSIPSFSFVSSISRFFAMLTHCFNLDALLVAISTGGLVCCPRGLPQRAGAHPHSQLHCSAPLRPPGLLAGRLDAPQTGWKH